MTALVWTFHNISQIASITAICCCRTDNRGTESLTLEQEWKYGIMKECSTNEQKDSQFFSSGIFAK